MGPRADSRSFKSRRWSGSQTDKFSGQRSSKQGRAAATAATDPTAPICRLNKFTEPRRRRGANEALREDGRSSHFQGGGGKAGRLCWWGGVGGRLLDLSRNREVRVRAAADSETSLKSSRLMVLQEVQPAHIKSTRPAGAQH